MKYRFVVRRDAKTDVRSAARQYELQRPELGREFVAQLDAALGRVVANPLQYQQLHRGVRRVILRRFPYGAFYRIEGDTLVVFCVMHLHRDPATWMGRAPK